MGWGTVIWLGRAVWRAEGPPSADQQRREFQKQWRDRVDAQMRTPYRCYCDHKHARFLEALACNIDCLRLGSRQ